MFSLLYVDDESGLLEIGQLFLESTGEFSVTSALSGQEALVQLSQHHFDAIVSDYQMPEMDGIGLLKCVRKSFGNVPFILFTGRGREEIVIEAINNGVDFYLQKGGDPGAQFAELAHKIRQAVARRQAENRLVESEKRLADIIDFLPEATFAIDRAGRIIAWNHAIEEMTGVPASEMLGKSDHEYAIPFYGERRPILIDMVFESDEVLAKYYTHISRDRGILVADTTLPRPKGNQRTLMGTASPLYNREGEVAGAIEAIRDVTDRKKAEEELAAANEQLAASKEKLQAQYDELAEGAKRLRESEEKYRLISENSPNMIYFIDPGGYIRYVNPFAAKAMHAEPGNLAGKHVTELFTPDTARQHLDAINRVIGSGTTLRNEIYEDLPSGGVWIDVRLSPLIDETGRVLGVLGLSHDISDRKQAEEALRESETKYRMLVENSHDIIYTISPEGILTFVSPGWTTLLGHDPAYVTGKPFQHFIHPADIPAFKAFLAHVVSTRQRQSGVEYRVFHADGSIHIHTSTISPVFNDKGSIISYIGSARDITEMKRFQTAIRESNRKLNLLSSITRHDVANQLTVVQGYTQSAALRKTDQITADFLAKIASAVDMIQHQIEFTRTYQDLGVQEPAWFRVGDVIRSLRPRRSRLSAPAIPRRSLPTR